jgi:hypothetical protein
VPEEGDEETGKSECEGDDGVAREVVVAAEWKEKGEETEKERGEGGEEPNVAAALEKKGEECSDDGSHDELSFGGKNSSEERRFEFEKLRTVEEGEYDEGNED